MVATGLEARGVSERLRRFVDEAPYEREPIVEFVVAAAEATAPGARVLDVGAGGAPYRELFEHARYATANWDSSEALPVEDRAFEVVLSTQALEHAPDPQRAMSELHRVLVEGGSLYLTVPLVRELQEPPADHYRYTPSALAFLLAGAGFEDVSIAPRNDCFATVAQLLLNARRTMGRRADGLDDRREQAAAVLEGLAEQLAPLGPLDARWELPLGFAATARRPTDR
jgi:SAM-dependent methyltransferase